MSEARAARTGGGAVGESCGPREGTRGGNGDGHGTKQDATPQPRGPHLVYSR